MEGIRAYRFPQETEDYTIDDPSAMDVDIDPQLIRRTQPEAQHSTQRSNLRLFPPPIFSRQGISQNYKYVAPGPSNTLIDVYTTVVVRYFSFKANPMSTVTTVVDEKTGEEKERLINKGRWKGFGPTSITFSEKAVGQYFFPHLSPWDRTCSFSEFLTLYVISMKVPTKPPSNVEEVRNQYDQSLVQQLEEVETLCDA